MIVSNRLERGVRATLRSPPQVKDSTPVASLPSSWVPSSLTDTGITSAMKLSAVDRCIEVLSDSMGKLPIYVMDRKTRERIENHPLNKILTLRPNEAQTPTVAKKMIECNRNCGTGGYAWIIRSPTTLRPEGYLPVPHELVTPWLDTDGYVWYTVIHPFTGSFMTVHRMDMIHTLGYTHDGYRGISVLSRASEVVGAARAAQRYNFSYYANGGQPAGVLKTETDLSGYVEITLPDGSTEKVSKKDLIRAEWEKRHSGPSNAQRVAILDYGLDYKPVSISNKDAQFVEQAELSVQDIARFFGVPLYKLQAGKQSYDSNEQNAIEYVVSTLHPIVTQYEEELTYKLLPPSEATKLRIRVNMMAELKGDITSRGQWYRIMREIGPFSVNDIRALEDLPDVEGGDDRMASLNYVPLSVWKDLSISRNTPQGGENA